MSLLKNILKLIKLSFILLISSVVRADGPYLLSMIILSPEAHPPLFIRSQHEFYRHQAKVVEYEPALVQKKFFKKKSSIPVQYYYEAIIPSFDKQSKLSLVKIKPIVKPGSAEMFSNEKIKIPYGNYDFINKLFLGHIEIYPQTKKDFKILLNFHNGEYIFNFSEQLTLNQWAVIDNHYSSALIRLSSL
jgi:hypothetical protein